MMKVMMKGQLKSKGKKKNESVNEDDMVFDPKTKAFKIKSGSMNWEKNFKWANDKELKVILNSYL